MSRQAIVGARRSGGHVGICCLGPSDFPHLADRLVELGIHSMRLDPDTVVHSKRIIADAESQLEVSGSFIRAGR